MIDMLFTVPFVTLLAPGMRWLFWVAFGVGILVAEFFSPFPFGTIGFALGIGWVVARALINIIDTSSLMSLAAAFLIGIFCEALFITLLFMFESSAATSTALLRGGVFMVRQLLAGVFLFALIMGIRSAYTVGVYAMAEEKNPFA